ncbi:MAG: hypothetical protein E3J72_06420 [Planctomycetota bacterium]|nr:MAG: hypothetical protein E3J72_06420 [Planctomycetota bacterium]
MERKRFALFLLIFAIGIAVPLMTGGGCKKDDKKKDQQVAIAIMIANHDAAAAANADLHEPDDSYAEAIAQGFFPADTLFDGTMYDDDIFAIDVPTGQLTITIDCYFFHAEGDIDISLDDDNFFELAYSEDVFDDEQIIITVPAPGTYFIWVWQWNFLPNGQDYQLIWTHRP